MGAFYNAALSHYFYMLLCYRVSERDFAKKHEPYIHAVCLGFPIATSVAGLFQEIYGPSALGCWITPQPRLCSIKDDIECESARWGVVYAWLYQGVPLIFLLGYIGYAMFGIYKKVKEVSQKADRWSSQKYTSSTISLPQSAKLNLKDLEDNDNNNKENSSSLGSPPTNENKSTDSFSMPTATSMALKKNRNAREKMSKHAERTKEAGAQAFLYIAAYLVTHGWAFIVCNSDWFTWKVPSVLMILENISWPLQGFLNLFVFLRPRIQTLQKHEPALNFFVAAYVSLFDYDEANPTRSLERLWFRKEKTEAEADGKTNMVTLNGHGRSLKMSALTSLEDEEQLEADVKKEDCDNLDYGDDYSEAQNKNDNKNDNEEGDEKSEGDGGADQSHTVDKYDLNGAAASSSFNKMEDFDSVELSETGSMDVRTQIHSNEHVDRTRFEDPFEDKYSGQVNDGEEEVEPENHNPPFSGNADGLSQTDRQEPGEPAAPEEAAKGKTRMGDASESAIETFEFGGDSERMSAPGVQPKLEKSR